MTINNQIRDEKLQYDINRKAAEMSVLSSSKIDKYENLTSKEILPSNQQQIIEQAKFIYSPLGKAFEKQIKTIEDQGEKHIRALEDLKTNKISWRKFSKNAGIKNEINKIKEYEKKVNRNNIDFKTFKTIRSFGEIIYSGKITINEANEEQADLIDYILNFNNKAKPKINA